MSEWRETTLGDVLTLQRGFDLPSRKRVDGPYPIVSSSGITGRHAVAKVDPPGVVIGRYGSLGSVYWVTEPYWPLNTALWVRDFKGNDPRYLSYLLRTVTYDGSTASAVPGVNRNHLHRLPVWLPSVATQRRIGAVLAAFDELTLINNRRVELLEHLVRSLYRGWFGQLRSEESGEPAISATGPTPSTTTAVGDICTVVRGRSYKRAELGEDGEGVPFLTLKCVARGGGFRPEGVKRYTGRFKDSQRVEAGETLVAVTDMTQERRIVAQAFRMPQIEDAFAVPSLDLAIVRPHREELRTYIYCFLRYSGFAERVKHFANGANVLHLAIERILEAPILMPDRTTLKSFCSATEPILERAEACHASNRALAHTRDLLLPRLVTGRLDISDIDLGDLLPDDEATAA